MNENCAKCGRADGAGIEQQWATRTVWICTRCIVNAPVKSGLTQKELAAIADRAANMVRGGAEDGIWRVNHSLANQVRNDVPRLAVAIRQLWQALATLAQDGVISQGRAAELAGLSASDWREVVNSLTDKHP